MILDSAIDLAPSTPKRNTKVREYGNAVLLLQRAADVAAICGGLVLALQAHDTPWSNQLLWSGVMGVGLFVFFADMKNVYRSWRTGSMRTEILYTAEAWIAVFVGLFAIGSIWPTLVYPAGVMLTWLVATSFLLAASRIGARHLLRIARRHGLNTKRLAIAGTGQLAHHVARTIARNNWMGFRAVGLFDHRQPIGEAGPRNRGETSKSLRSIVDLAKNGEIDTVFIALPTSQCAREIDTLIEALGDTTASVYLLEDRRRPRLPWLSRSDEADSDAIPRPLQHDPLHRCRMEIGGIPAVSVFETPFLGASGWLKRIEDIVISTIALLLLAVPMLAIAIGVKQSSPGPILFKQRRYGLAGEEIEVWKFRSMTVCEDGDDVIQARRTDPRVTAFGAFIRRTSLDELPQFINVLLGSMSIVGPRPHAVSHNEHYRKLVGGYMLRHKVKPGITGLAQINGWRGETDTIEKMAKRVELDLDYIRNWSLWLDLTIVARTLATGFSGKNAF
jgi:putative colanic acid biosysnthesis UDP-glucose lipid carrier transferase